LDLPAPAEENGYFYGVFLLGLELNSAQFLIFGGYNSETSMNRTCLFTTDLTDFQSSNFQIKEDLPDPDEFFNNHPSHSQDSVTIAGSDAVHTFDKAGFRWTTD